MCKRVLQKQGAFRIYSQKSPIQSGLFFRIYVQKSPTKRGVFSVSLCKRAL